MSAETLLDIFRPPEGLVGHSAALVAMTGATDFLEDAVQRFTGLRPRQRAELGNVLVYLMLDGHASSSRQEVFPPGRIPGLHEFHPREVMASSLMHAKVALLAFAETRTGTPTHLRLAVLTANFTYESARRQLELAWCVDVPLSRTARPQDRADVATAGAFVQTLLAQRFHRDEQSLPSKVRSLTLRLDMLLAAASSLATNRKPRFIHSLDRPLYDQIRERFRIGIDSPRNLLLCGSGFYEQPSTKASKPSIFDKLEDLGVFTTSVRRVALVEPGKAGAVATWAKGGDTEDWEIVRPFDALEQNRRLHAKFVYAGHLRDGHVSNGWLYLGSGNLSRRGILTHGRMAQGNVETGVVFEVRERLDSEEIEGRLFWLNEAEPVGDEDWAIGQVGDAPDDQPILETPPILSAVIRNTPARHLSLLWREDDSRARASISWTGRGWIDVQGMGEVPLTDHENPTTLSVRGGRGREWVVPVVDTGGRVGWQPPRYETFADALEALLDFPIRPAEAIDEEDPHERDGNGGILGRDANAKAIEQKSYALHAAAELVERLAELQISLPVSMLDDWLDHLDRMFRASFPEPLIATWRMHRLDIFAHLRKPEFRSPHLTDTQRVRYFEVLDGAARSWKLQ